MMSGCYYAQAIKGHVSLMSKREPIERVIASPETPAPVREQLTLALSVRDFASRELRLPDNDSYRTYVDLEGEPPVWLVVAAPEFSVEPRRWCYLFVGCLSYRGYFNRDAADRLAERLREKGLDVAVVPGGAYSTLGWFADPLLSTMIERGETDLAGLIFHELAHQVLFVDGDTGFNESFATTVERIGLRRWLAGRDLNIDARERNRQLDLRISQLMLETRESLEEVYRSEADEVAMRRAKQRQIADLVSQLRAMGVQGYAPQDINNATLSLVAAYEDGVPAFEGLLRACNGGLECFYDAAKERAGWDEEARRNWLRGRD